MAGTSEELAFKKLNAFRAAQGLGPLNQNAKIDIAVKNHAAYVTTNLSGADPHKEVAGKPGLLVLTCRIVWWLLTIRPRRPPR